MITVHEHEMHEILSNLVDAWSEGELHPVVERAREYRELYPPFYSGNAAPHNASDDQPEDYHDALWFSI